MHGDGIAKRWLIVAGALAGLVLLAGACGGRDEPKAKDASTPAAAGTAAPTGSAQGRTFTDDSGKTLTIEKPPARVVALSPSVVELLYAVGAPPIARPSSATFPEAARALPDIGTAYQPSFEQVAAQNPDLIIADAQLQSPQTLAELAKIGAPIFSVRVQNVADVARLLRTLGAIMGKTEEGERAAAQLEAKLAAVEAKLPPSAERPGVFIMVGTADAFWAAKPDSFAGDVVARLGARNLVQEGPDTTQFPGFTTYSLERLAALDPDVILVISVAGPNAPPTSRQLAGNPAWSGLRAVRTGRVAEVPVGPLVQSAGPRVGEVIDMLGPILYPGRF